MEQSIVMKTIGRDKAEQIINNYRRGFQSRKVSGEALVTNLVAYLEAGGYKAKKVPRRQILKLAESLGVIQIVRGRHGGIIPPLTAEEQNALLVARQVVKEPEPEPAEPSKGTQQFDPLAGLSETERSLIMKMAATMRAQKE
jgi:hypothetical protein